MSEFRFPKTCRRGSSLALVVLLFHLLAGGQAGSHQPIAGDSEILLAVAASKEWSGLAQLKSWNMSFAPDHCSWSGVTCAGGGGGGVVTELALPHLRLAGTVPASVCELKNLTRLDLSYNNLTGAFPAAALYACVELRFLDLSNNLFSGHLPRDIDRLSPAMERLNLSTNSFAGEVPAAVARLTALKSLLLHTNRFTGAYPAAGISELDGLQVLTLGGNAFAPGAVPAEFAKLTNLTFLWMDGMNLTGEIPEAFSSLTELKVLSLASNKLTGKIPAWVLQHEKLQSIYLFDNSLSGELPRNVTAVNLVELDVSTNKLTGTIPASIGLLRQLKDVRLFNNRLSGQLPPELGKHSPLGNLDVSNNNLSGPLPETLCSNEKLYDIVAFNNSFSGEFPARLGDCVTINNLMVYNNRFSGDFPAKMWSFPKLTTVMIQNNSFTGHLPSKIPSNLSRIEMGNNMFSGFFPSSGMGLTVFDAKNNRLGGKLPSDMSKLTNLIELSVHGNRLTGSIPASINLLQKLSTLDLSGNQISGVIQPGSIGRLPALMSLDLSNNKLEGEIPSDINLMKKLNLSSNQFTGEVPAQLQMAAYGRSYLGNPGLCARAGSGLNLLTCRGVSIKQSRDKTILFAMLAGTVVLVASIIGIASWLLLIRRRSSRERQEVKDWKMTAYTPELNFSLSDVLSNLREENVIGSGGSCEVYRMHLGSRCRNNDDVGVVQGCASRMYEAIKRSWTTNSSRKEDGRRHHAGRIVAVKRMVCDSGPMVEKQFDAEIEVLGSVRHENIVELLCCMHSKEEKLIVLECMENGSLDRWLHHRDDGAPTTTLDWLTRLSIAIDAARALSHMHHDSDSPIVHRDVKSKNILLDQNIRAKIADFGLSVFLAAPGQFVLVSTVAGTRGYMAPEILRRPTVNEKVDVYSFGVLLLELISGKAPDAGDTDIGLAEWGSRVWQHCQNGARFEDAVDEAIRSDDPVYKKQIRRVFIVGLCCTMNDPRTRPLMSEVLQHLITCQQQII